jgi:hypothetical protein
MGTMYGRAKIKRRFSSSSPSKTYTVTKADGSKVTRARKGFHYAGVKNLSKYNRYTKQAANQKAAEQAQIKSYKALWNKKMAEVTAAKMNIRNNASKIKSIRFDLTSRQKTRGQKGYIPLGKRGALVRAKVYAMKQQARNLLAMERAEVKRVEAVLLARKK